MNPVKILERAAQLRADAHPETKLLDSQKVPWIILAASSEEGA